MPNGAARRIPKGTTRRKKSRGERRLAAFQASQADQQPLQTGAGEVDGSLFGFAAALDLLHHTLAEGGMADDLAHRQGHALRFRLGLRAAA